MHPSAKLSIVARSPSWSAILQHRLADAHLSWALDVDDVLTEVAATVGRPIIIELVESQLVRDCSKVFAASNLPCQARFFAVGGAWIESYQAVIRASGFVDICGSFAKFENLERLIRRQFQLAAQSSIIDQESIRDNLPWKPVRNHV